MKQSSLLLALLLCLIAVGGLAVLFREKEDTPLPDIGTDSSTGTEGIVPVNGIEIETDSFIL